MHDSAAPRSIGITILAVLAVVYTLYFGRALFVPVVLASLLNFLFSPLVRAARRIGIPSGVTAALVVLTLLGVFGGGAYELATPARAWLAAAPATLSKAGRRVHQILRPVEQVTRTAEQVEKATNVGAPAVAPTQVVVAGPSLGARFFGTTSTLLASTLEVLVLLFFLLSAGDLFLQKLLKVLPQLGEKQAAVDIARETESSISTYLITSALLNATEGTVVAVVLHLLGMPNAALWGAMVAVLEFVPYLGAATAVVVLGLAGLTVFPAAGHALLMPAAFLTINLIQGNFVTPMVMGRRLSLNPVAIFVGLAFWWEIWGIAGAFLAVPLLATFKIFCDHIATLAPVGEFLGEREEGERRLTVRPSDAA